jgi:outer membrane protein assembly factor BamE (lipoprotein component of BamABCDE complex)
MPTRAVHRSQRTNIRSKRACLLGRTDLPISVRIVVAALLMVSMVGCSSVVGTQIAKEKVTQIRVGVTTEPELLLLLGPPATKTLDATGRMVLTWAYSRAKVKPETFTVAGPFLGGYNTHVQQLTVLLDRKGRVESFTFNDTPGEVRYGQRR